MILDLKKLIKESEELREKGVQKYLEEDLEEDTLCGKPHNNGNNEPEECTECMVIKLGI